MNPYLFTVIIIQALIISVGKNPCTSEPHIVQTHGVQGSTVIYILVFFLCCSCPIYFLWGRKHHFVRVTFQKERGKETKIWD